MDGSVGQWFSVEQFIGGHWQRLDTFWFSQLGWEYYFGKYWVKARNATKQPTVHKTRIIRNKNLEYPAYNCSQCQGYKRATFFDLKP